MRLTSGGKAALGTIIGGTLLGVAIVSRQGGESMTKLVPPAPAPRPTAAVRAAEVPAAEAGQLWRLAGTASVPRRPPVPVERQANYLQGPLLVRHDGGAGWSLLANAGYCCDVPLPWGPGYEGIVRLAVPAGTWEWLAVTNDFGPGSARDEHELAFPTYYQGRIPYTATRWSEHAEPIHERVGTSLLTGAWGATWTRPNATWLPAGGGSARWSVALMADPATGKEWLYTRDTTGTGAQSIVRRQVMSSGALGPAKATTWAGFPAGAHPSITDVVRAGSTWYALEEVSEWPTPPWGWHELAEWRSTAQAQPLPVDVGVIWEPTGRRIRPGLRTAWDAGYARTETGDLAGRLVVHMCGDGTNADTGAWEVCVWQPAGEVIPAALAPLLVPVVDPLPTPTPGPTLPPEPTPTPGGPTPVPTATPTVGPPSPTATPTPEPVLSYRLPDGHVLQVSCTGDLCQMAGGGAGWQMVGPWTVQVVKP